MPTHFERIPIKINLIRQMSWEQASEVGKAAREGRKFVITRFGVYDKRDGKYFVDLDLELEWSKDDAEAD